MCSLSERLLGKTGVEIAANQNNETVGSVIVTKRNGEAYVGYLGVKPAQRGRGVGSQLLERAEDWSRREGLSIIGGKLIPVPGSEESLKKLIINRGYKVDKTGSVSKKL